MGSLNLLQAAQLNGCKNIIFSSTCAVYGDQPREPLSEDAPLNPSNAYAASKLAAEHLLQNFQHIMPLKYLIFRYFNVAGADPTGRLGECHMPETHLIPCLLQAAEAGKDIQVFGTNYQTPDGTCLRDFIHVSDIARAYVCGVQWLLHGKASQIFNLGSGRGYSVLQVISAVSKLTGQKIKITAAPRRLCIAASGYKAGGPIVGLVSATIVFRCDYSRCPALAARGRLCPIAVSI